MRIKKALRKIRIMYNFFSTLQYRQSLDELLTPFHGCFVKEIIVLNVGPEIKNVLIRLEKKLVNFSYHFDKPIVEIVSNEYLAYLPSYMSSMLFKQGKCFIGKKFVDHRFKYSDNGVEGVELEFENLPEFTLFITTIYGKNKPETFEESARIGICKYTFSNNEIIGHP